MILGYGAYRHAPHECALVIARRPVYSPRGSPQFTRENWQIAGWLHAVDPPALTLALANLQAAYELAGQDAVLYLDDGVTPTHHQLRSALALGGVRVTGLDFPRGTGAEYSTFRSYRISLEADFPAADPLLWDYVETVAQLGTGGPRRVLIETLDGPVQEQQVASQTVCRAVQSGHALGSTHDPDVSPPLWLAAELPDRRQIRFHTPRRTAGGLSHFLVEWHYEYASGHPLLGGPTPR
jgi:hypothetical protein